VSVIETAFPASDLEALGPLNRLTSLVLEQCAPTGQEMSQLSSGIVSLIISNTIRGDVDPPIVLGPTISDPVFDQENNRYAITVTWLALDFGSDIDTHSLWASDDFGPFYFVPNVQITRTDKSRFTTTVYFPSTQADIQFALTVRDSAGNWSARSSAQQPRHRRPQRASMRPRRPAVPSRSGGTDVDVSSARDHTETTREQHFTAPAAGTNGMVEPTGAGVSKKSAANTSLKGRGRKRLAVPAVKPSRVRFFRPRLVCS
jgi:hypothetical protein